MIYIFRKLLIYIINTSCCDFWLILFLSNARNFNIIVTSNDFLRKISLLIFSTFVFSILWFFNCSWVTLELYKSQLVELRIYTKSDIIFFLQFYAALKLSDNFFNLIKLNVHFQLLWMIYIFRKFLVHIINISCSDFSLILLLSNAPNFNILFTA